MSLSLTTQLLQHKKQLLQRAISALSDCLITTLGILKFSTHAALCGIVEILLPSHDSCSSESKVASTYLILGTLHFQPSTVSQVVDIFTTLFDRA